LINWFHIVPPKKISVKYRHACNMSSLSRGMPQYGMISFDGIIIKYVANLCKRIRPFDLKMDVNTLLLCYTMCKNMLCIVLFASIEQTLQNVNPVSCNIHLVESLVHHPAATQFIPQEAS